MSEESLTLHCPRCGEGFSEAVLRAALRVCPNCGAHLAMPVAERIASLVDPDSFKELDRGLVSIDPLVFTDQRSYRERLLEARRRTGLR
ncbi:MAG: acetyl-CoA carboxylase carboxyl transferase subunit beta, partial [Anaerolineales bacterium]